jgi:hypothetical protein
MRHSLKSGLTIGMLVAALAMTGGCGSNDNSNGNDNGAPRATRTPTPASRTSTPAGATSTPAGATATVAGPTATATPTGGQQTVDFNFTATQGIQGFQVNVTYPTAKGSFTGSGSSVGCTTTASGIFTKNDKDDGNLVLSVASTDNLTFPIAITCTFDATSEISGSDIALTVTEVTQNNTSGDKTALGSTITVNPLP